MTASPKTLNALPVSRTVRPVTQLALCGGEQSVHKGNRLVGNRAGAWQQEQERTRQNQQGIRPCQYQLGPNPSSHEPLLPTEHLHQDVGQQEESEQMRPDFPSAVLMEKPSHTGRSGRGDDQDRYQDAEQHEYPILHLVLPQDHPSPRPSNQHQRAVYDICGRKQALDDMNPNRNRRLDNKALLSQQCAHRQQSDPQQHPWLQPDRSAPRLTEHTGKTVVHRVGCDCQDCIMRAGGTDPRLMMNLTPSATDMSSLTICSSGTW